MFIEISFLVQNYNIELKSDIKACKRATFVYIFANEYISDH